jgi:hypothetical protein
MFSLATLRQLGAHTRGPRVSLFLPTHPSSAKTQDGATHLKNLIRDAKNALESQGTTPADADALLAPAEQLVGDRFFWQDQHHGLALFLSPTGMVQVSVAHDLIPQAVVADHFDVLPLLPGLATEGDYVLVCASQDDVTVYRGNATGLDPITVDGLPTSLDDVLTDADYENPVLASPPARPNTGTHNISNAQVYGAAPPEWQAMVRRKFAGRLAAALNASAHLVNTPAVLIADNDMAGDLAEAMGAVALDTTHPTSLGEPERHDVSWRLVSETLDARRQEHLATMAERIGQNDAVATDPADIAQQAETGRVDRLFIATDTPDTIISRALWHTLDNGGEIIWAGDADAPPATGVVALLRY